MRSDVCAVIVILILVSFSGCTEKNDNDDKPNPPVNWTSSSGHSQDVYFEIITDRDVYNETQIVNISVLLHSTLDHNVTFEVSNGPGYTISVFDKSGDYIDFYPLGGELATMNYEIQSNSTINFSNWLWNQTFPDDYDEYPGYYIPVKRNQGVNITCTFDLTGENRFDNGLYYPIGWKTIWLK